jgi:CxxC motif-containing protein
MSTPKKEVRRINCIVCPLGCVGELNLEDGKITQITGFTCERGNKYGQEEIKSPKRVLTTTVRVIGGEISLLPVISKEPLPKDQVIPCARHLACLSVEGPIVEGQVVCANILNLGVDMVAARDIRRLK